MAGGGGEGMKVRAAMRISGNERGGTVRKEVLKEVRREWAGSGDGEGKGMWCWWW